MDYVLEQVPEVAQNILSGARRRRAPDHATLITLSGDLGAGKTTLVQEIARQLGITGTLQSPTFVIYKKYGLTGEWSTLVHGDMYRLESAEDIEKLDWNDLLADPNNLIIIEWPEQITGAIPEWATCVVIQHLGGEKRHIEI